MARVSLTPRVVPMITLRQRCEAFARAVLSAYVLSDDERAHEREILAECVRSVTEMCLENLAHRAKEAG